MSLICPSMYLENGNEVSLFNYFPPPIIGNVQYPDTGYSEPPHMGKWQYPHTIPNTYPCGDDVESPRTSMTKMSQLLGKKGTNPPSSTNGRPGRGKCGGETPWLRLLTTSSGQLHLQRHSVLMSDELIRGDTAEWLALTLCALTWFGCIICPT